MERRRNLFANRLNVISRPSGNNNTSSAKKSVLIINWDSYPNVTTGGIYSWEKALVENLPEFRFTIINILSNPGANCNITIPDNIEKVICVPLFGSFRIDEYLNIDDIYDEDEKKRRPAKGNNYNPLFSNSTFKINSFTRFLARLSKTNNSIIKSQFVSLFISFLQCTVSPNRNNEFDPRKILRAAMDLHNFFKCYDTRKCLEHEVTWKAFQNFLISSPIYRFMSAEEALNIYHVLQRDLQLLAIPVRKFDIVHSSLAWLPSLIALVAKAEYGTPFLLTEHGVAFKELLLYYNTKSMDQPSGIFWRNFSMNVIKTFYAFADRIAPVCYANARWEKYLIEKDESKINVIYNGVDTLKFSGKISSDLSETSVECNNVLYSNNGDNDDFLHHTLKKSEDATMATKLGDGMESSAQNPRNDDDYKRRYFNDASQTADDTISAISKRTRPVIVFVGRIDPLKDIVKLLVAISYVRREIPEVLCKIYGTASSIEYAKKCVNIVKSYGLQNNVLFMGGTKSPETAYFESDVVAICSVSEGFPFSVIEAMASAKLVVATNVGGVSEALDGCGFLVPPADPRVFANALVSALMNEKRRKELARRSQAVAQTRFDLQTMVERYQQQYDLLMKKSMFISNDSNNNNNNYHPDRSDAE